jgi:tetratricopeptide (TPR) repeat protein
MNYPPTNVLGAALLSLLSALTGPFTTAQPAWAQSDAAAQAAAWIGVGVSEMKLWHDDRALEALHRALTLDGQAAPAHVLLGDLYFRRDELTASVQHYEAAGRLDPNDVAVQDRLVMAREHAQADVAFHRLYTPHFLIKFQPADRPLARDVGDSLESLYQAVGKQLSYLPAEPMTVILHSQRTFAGLTGSPPWARGLFDGKIHIAARARPGGQAEIAAALAHEYVHAAVHRLSGGHAPTWLSEGLALSFEREREPSGEASPPRLSAADELIPLHALHGSFLGLSQQQASLAYADSLSGVRALIDRYGMSQVARLLHNLSDAPDFAETFEKTLGEPYREFEARWTSSRQGSRAGTM